MFYKKREFLTSKIPVLRIHTKKTSLVVQIYISTFFLGPKNLTIKGYQKKIQLCFSSKFKVPQLGSARHLPSSARLGLITKLGVHTVGVHTVGVHTVGVHTVGVHTVGVHTIGVHTVGQK